MEERRCAASDIAANKAIFLRKIARGPYHAKHRAVVIYPSGAATGPEGPNVTAQHEVLGIQSDKPSAGGTTLRRDAVPPGLGYVSLATQDFVLGSHISCLRHLPLAQFKQIAFCSRFSAATVPALSPISRRAKLSTTPHLPDEDFRRANRLLPPAHAQISRIPRPLRLLPL
jgi:hypothetical protein